MPTYKRIIIYFFSGTGNSRKIAIWIREFALQQNINCEIVSIANTNPEQIEVPSRDSLIAFISPIHGFNYPKITLDFIFHFPRGSNNIILMNTRAGMKFGNRVTPGLTGIAFILSSCILKSKGYKIVGQIPFDMPSNWISIHPQLSHNAMLFIYERNKKLVIKYFSRILSGKPVFVAVRDIVQDILISPISLAYYLGGRFIFAKSFYASSKCDKCGLCVKKCPVKAIKKVNNQLFWSFKCESCMKCLNDCPQKAIEVSHGLFIFCGIIFSLVSSFLIESILSLYIQSEILRQVIYTITFIFILYLTYRIQHISLKSKILSKFIGATSLTTYKFWRNK